MHQYDIHGPAHYTDANGVVATATRVSDGKVQCPIAECSLLLATQRIFLRHLKRVHQLLPPPASAAAPAPAPATIAQTSPDVAQQADVGLDDAPKVPSTQLQAGMS